MVSMVTGGCDPEESCSFNLSTLYYHSLLIEVSDVNSKFTWLAPISCAPKVLSPLQQWYTGVVSRLLWSNSIEIVASFQWNNSVISVEWQRHFNGTTALSQWNKSGISMELHLPTLLSLAYTVAYTANPFVVQWVNLKSDSSVGKKHEKILMIFLQHMSASES